MMITRYAMEDHSTYSLGESTMEPFSDGDYVRYDDHMAALAAAKGAGWVACETAMPEIEQFVAGWSAKYGVMELQWFGAHWSHWPTHDYIPSAFTHWMPLPIPPITAAFRAAEPAECHRCRIPPITTTDDRGTT